MLLAFLLMMQEVNMAVMVKAHGALTFPMVVWDELETGMYPRAAALSLMQVAVIVTIYVAGRYFVGRDFLSSSTRKAGA
jgi:ABC-type spermidine/putrescine transport system permease subunit II